MGNIDLSNDNGVQPNTPQDDKDQYKKPCEEDLSDEILRMVEKSIEKIQRRKSTKKQKRKRYFPNISQPNGSDADDEKNAYSRCSITFFSKVVKRVKTCLEYVELVKSMGFAEMLEIDDCCVPRGFVQWIAENINTDQEMIEIGCSFIQLSPQSVTETVGTPVGEIQKYLRDPGRNKRIYQTLGGCIYSLAVRCLDHIDFGPINTPSTLPRIRVWKGNLIKVFSEMENTVHIQLKISLKPVIPKWKLNIKLLTILKRKSNYGSSGPCCSSVTCLASHEIASEETLKLTSSANDDESFQIAFENTSNSNMQIFGNNHDTSPLKRKKSNNEEDASSQQSMSTIKQTSSQRNVDAVPKDGPSQQVDVNHEVNPKESSINQSQDFKTTINTAHTSVQIIESQETDGEKDDQPLIKQKRKSNNADASYQHTMSSENQNTSQGSEVAETNNPPIHTVEVNHMLQEQKEPTPPANMTNASKVNCTIASASGVCLKEAEIDSTLNRSEYLEKARHKYRWNDPSMPSFRLEENVDDFGTTIEEPELWRPTDMDDINYFKKIENAKLEWELKQIEEQVLFESPNISQKIPSTQPEIKESSGCETSIQCAQKEPTVTGLTNSPIWNFRMKDDFVDLVSPDVMNTTQEHINLKESNSSTTHKKFTTNALIVGRKLFDESTSTYNNTSNIKTGTSEVKILGEISFNTACNQMAKQNDDIYNTTLSLGTDNEFQGKENLRLQRVIQRSKWVRSPYEGQHTVTILPIHEIVWEAVTTLCESNAYKFYWVINIDMVCITMVQLGKSMMMDGKVEAWVINAFCIKLFRDKHPRISGKHYFFNTTSEFFLEKWKKDEAKKDFHTRAIDSFKDTNFIKIWYELGLPDKKFREFGKIYPNVPKQKPGTNDCGIYCMKFMELFCPRNPHQCSFSSTDIPSFRIRYAHDMVMTDHNVVHDAKQLVSTFRAEDHIL
ncbi:unnamed protein product [Alopecurus aequalis]